VLPAAGLVTVSEGTAIANAPLVALIVGPDVRRVMRTSAVFVVGPVTAQLKRPVLETTVRNWNVLPPSRDRSTRIDELERRLLVQVMGSYVPV